MMQITFEEDDEEDNKSRLESDSQIIHLSDVGLLSLNLDGCMYLVYLMRLFNFS